jgi:hypothetical protein
MIRNATPFTRPREEDFEGLVIAEWMPPLPRLVHATTEADRMPVVIIENTDLVVEDPRVIANCESKLECRFCDKRSENLDA